MAQNTKNTKFEKDPNELGALWLKDGQKGEYLTGEIILDGQMIKLVCFSVTSDNPNAPVWRVFKSVPREGTTAPVPAAKKQAATAPEPTVEEDVAF